MVVCQAEQHSSLSIIYWESNKYKKVIYRAIERKWEIDMKMFISHYLLKHISMFFDFFQDGVWNIQFPVTCGKFKFWLGGTVKIGATAD